MVDGDVGMYCVIDFNTCCQHINKFLGQVTGETISGHEFFDDLEF